MILRSIGLIAGSAFLLAACGASTATAPGASASPSHMMVHPKIRITSPSAGSSLSGELAVIRVAVTGFKFDGTKIGTPPSEGVGHYHLLIDGKYAGLSVSDAIAVPNAAFPNVSAGQHEIKVELHNNDHSPVKGAMADAVTVTFANAMACGMFCANAPAPTVAIEMPAKNAHLLGTTLVEVAVMGLTLDGTKIGTPATAGIGHYHLVIDGKYAGLSVTPVISFPNDAFPTVTAGTHTITIELHDNMHAPLSPAVSTSITVTFDQAVTYSAAAA